MNLVELTVEQIEKVYVGKDNGCRCGCHGTYTYTSENERKVRSVLKRAQKQVATGVGFITDRGADYLNVSYGNDRAVCIYVIK